MAVCGSCGREGTRVRTIFEINGKPLPVPLDECPGCKPGSFEPRWWTERGAMGWEAYPNQYKARRMPDGSVGYFATDELRADTEAKIARESEDDRRARENAIARKRQAVAGARRSLTQGEQESIIAKYREQEAKGIEERKARLDAMAVGLQLPN